MPSDAAWWAPPQWSRQPPAQRVPPQWRCVQVCKSAERVTARRRSGRAITCAHETWPSPRESRARDVGSWWFRITGAECALRLPPQWRYVYVPARATAVAQWARGMCYDVLVAGDQSVGCLPSAVAVVVGARIVTSANGAETPPTSTVCPHLPPRGAMSSRLVAAAVVRFISLMDTPPFDLRAGIREGA